LFTSEHNKESLKVIHYNTIRSHTTTAKVLYSNCGRNRHPFEYIWHFKIVWPWHQQGHWKHHPSVHCVSKNAPPLTCYNLDIHDPIKIIFGRSVTKKVRNWMMLCFPTSSVYWFCTTLWNRKPRNSVFSLKHSMLLCQRTHKTFKLSPGRCWITLHSKSDRLHASEN